MRSPFTGLRFARLEFNNMKASGWVLFSICAVALIPLVYAGLFLLAFLDPYGSLVNVPAAVVNLDQGAEIDDEEANVGDTLCEKLVENNEDRVEGQASGYDWHFVSEKDAAKGLENGTYYMELIIPKNFSENIASASDEDPEKAELQVYFNPSTNLIATTVGQSMVTKIKSELNAEIAEDYFDNIFVSISDAADSLGDAVDGSGELADGLDQLTDGSQTLTDGLDTAEDGSSSLASGLDKLEDGSSTLTKGLNSASKGSSSLSKGINSAKSGSSKITSGAKSLSSGADAVDTGVGQVSSGLKQLKDGIDAASSGSATLSECITGVASALQAYSSTGDSSYLSTATTLAGKVKEANSTIGDDLYTYVTDLTSALTTYQSAATKSATKKAEMTSAQQAMTESYSAVSSATGSLTSSVAAVYNQSTGSGSAATLGGAAQAYATAAAAVNPSDPTTYASALTAAGSLAQAAAVVCSTGGESGSIFTLLANLSAFNSALSTYQEKATDYQNVAAQYQTLATTEAQAAAAASEAKGQVTGYLTGVKNTSAYASASTSQMSTAIDQLYTAVSGQLASGTSALASGAESLYTGSKTLTLGLGSAAKGAKSLTSGIKSAASGSKTITDNLGTAADGADDLTEGLDSAASGSETITKNLKTATDGADELADGLEDGQEEMADSVEGKDAKAEMMSSPVTANGELNTGSTITTVSNYGTGFAPYFIGLGMWVGALMISFLVRSLNNRILMSHASSVSSVLASYLPMVGVAFIQVVILLLFIQFGLKFSVNFPLQYYLFGLLVAMCFVAIVQFFRAAFGTAGMVIIVVLLMLQLCTAAGTFPIEAEIDFFNALNPFLPMTYVVNGFRMAMCGLGVDQMVMDFIVLGIFTVGFLFLSTCVAHAKRKVSMNTLYPKIQMVH